MLTLHIPDQAYFDEQREEFVEVKGTTINMEHSLVAISKWEAKFHKSFFKGDITPEEMLYYYKCMTITQNVPDSVYQTLPASSIKEITDYMNDPMTATTITEIPGRKKSRSSETVTSELIYFWMTAYNIPIEFQKWHINRLITLIRVAEVKNEDPKKMSKNEIMKQNAALNAARRKAHNSKG